MTGAFGQVVDVQVSVLGRASLLWEETVGLTEAIETSVSDGAAWRFTQTPEGQGLALVDWSAL